MKLIKFCFVKLNSILKFLSNYYLVLDILSTKVIEIRTSTERQEDIVSSLKLILNN